MRDTFEEAYQAVKKTDFLSEFKTIAKTMVWFTVPLWIVPYAIVRKIKEMLN